jgi:hypothetical protein
MTNVITPVHDQQDMPFNQPEDHVDKEKRRQLWTIWFAGLLILVGIFYGANSLDILPEIAGDTEWDKVEWGDWVFLTAGLWGLAISAFRIYSPDWPLPSAWDWIGGFGLTAVGLSKFIENNAFDFAGVNSELFGAVAIGLAGVALLLYTLRTINQE